MKTKYLDELEVIIPIVMILAIIIFLIYGGSYFGFSTTFTSNLVSVLPGLSIFALGAGSIAVIGASGFVVAGFGIMGIGMALLVDEMNTIGVLIPDILTATFTLPRLQLTILIFFLVIGALVSAARR